MATTAEGRVRATRLLLKMTGLDDHIIVRRYINIDESHTEWDWDGLAEAQLSHGERIAVEVLRAIVLGHSTVRVSDLYDLDDEYRQVCLDALRHALIGQDIPVL
jgi:hypothetical protein